jgi:hypothetical protein
MDIDLTDLIILAVLIGIAVVGLFLVSAGGGVYGLGLAIFVVAVIGAFWWVKRYYDRIGSGQS